jgi:hypothetical protein
VELPVLLGSGNELIGLQRVSQVAHALHKVSSPILDDGETKMMMRNLSLTFLLGIGLAATGCAAQAVDSPDDPNDPNDPNDPDLPVPTSPEGTFAVTSTFDIATNAPGTPGTIANYFINATDDPDDPTKFIVDESPRRCRMAR